MSRDIQAGVNCSLPFFSSTLNATTAPCLTGPYETGTLKSGCDGPQNGVSTHRTLFESSQLAGGNADYVEQLYESWLADPSSVEATWSKYFETFKGRESGDVSHTAAIARIEAAQKQRPGAAAVAGPVSDEREHRAGPWPAAA